MKITREFVDDSIRRSKINSIRDSYYTESLRERLRLRIRAEYEANLKMIDRLCELLKAALERKDK